MRIGLFHGYELIGSGSNEFNRYCAQHLLQLGHDVHVVCREKNVEMISFCSKAYSWHVTENSLTAESNLIYSNKNLSVMGPFCFIHTLQSWPVYPVFIEDKSREGRDVINIFYICNTSLLKLNKPFEKCSEKVQKLTMFISESIFFSEAAFLRKLQNIKIFPILSHKQQLVW